MNRDRWLAWPMSAPLLVCVAFLVSVFADRFSPYEATILGLQLLPLCALALVPRATLRDGSWWALIAIVIGLLGWMALVQVTAPTAMPGGWWRFCQRSAAISMFVYATSGRVDGRTLLHHLGSASALAAVVVVLINRWDGYHGHLETRCFGYGHGNIFANTVGPALWGWIALLILDRDCPRPRWMVPLASIGCMAFLAFVLDTGRRGAVLSLGAAAAAVLVALAWHRWRKVTLILIAGGALIALTAAIPALQQGGIPGSRSERLVLYQAAVMTGSDRLLTGHGHYAALQMQWADNEPARRLTAAGTWAMHAHSEPLDILLDGGLVAVLLAGAAAALTAVKIRRIGSDPQRRAAYAMAAAICTHAFTDNVYGTEIGEIWLGLALGVIWAMPSRPIRLPEWAAECCGRVSSRVLCWPFVIVAVIGAIRAIYPAVVHSEAYPSVHIAASSQALDPVSIHLHAMHALRADPPLDPASARGLIDRTAERGGWSMPLLLAGARHCTGGDPADRDGRESVAIFVRLLSCNPFSRATYEALAQEARRHPAVDLPRHIRRRLDMLTAAPGVASADLAHLRVDSIEHAADTYAAITHAIARGVAWEEIVPALRRLIEAYGDMSDVAELALRAAVAAPEAFSWLPEKATLRIGLRYTANLAAILNEVETPEQARKLLPLLEWLYPHWFAAWRSHRTGDVGEAGALYLAVARIHSLSRQ